MSGARPLSDLSPLAPLFPGEQLRMECSVIGTGENA